MKTNKVKWLALAIAISICSIAFTRKMTLTPCQTECKRISNVKYNVCLRLAPQNQTTCISRVLAEYSRCLGGCQ